ncbi:hypothetical protein D8B26_003887 [Coccidioides posadasii str. Silveira]|uniref:Uncharacterized protein n=3 Tax=Coccidioides posadasii TaxID=199306 RepID=E9D995_COCPS|nr:conserved hypothetical protein [Coccidioides posadasii C735 delta SOWgp]EER29553.1 conserved hypothetical protein [Coccidioides posadasii C735 delta SOWgp]EFW17129.1 conserved hypothetical protein [Coccidioides posadasii str. Silveira]KMM70037.1 hypothetical protein CPAG_06349 [Coccidioides posadasii RMSCC 3488]QVM09224.1 hypothetical protein D8B26_003887 [Coccidioides posadasii str. Silveira]|eukprot:XP_003071698.1 conserved hypothetical protein [Coccidioides posadasii C735 delta SOWgp]
MEHRTEQLSSEEAANKARGYKAAMHNPRVSEPAKQHAEERLHDIESTGQLEQRDEEDKDQGNVARGLKAAAHNPRVSEQAKHEAEERLESMERE